MPQTAMYRIKAFTLLESLLTLSITTFIVIVLSGSLGKIFTSIEESLFFIQFENVYRETQRLSVISQTPQTLSLSTSDVQTATTHLVLPVSIKGQVQVIHFNQAGGNSTLTKVVFEMEDKDVQYQLYLGNGNFKKKEVARVYTP